MYVEWIDQDESELFLFYNNTKQGVSKVNNR